MHVKLYVLWKPITTITHIFICFFLLPPFFFFLGGGLPASSLRPTDITSLTPDSSLFFFFQFTFASSKVKKGKKESYSQAIHAKSRSSNSLIALQKEEP